MSEKNIEKSKVQLKRGDSEQDEEKGIWDDQDLGQPKTGFPFRGTWLGGPDFGLEEAEGKGRGKQQEERERKEKEKNLQLASRGAPPPGPKDPEESDKISEKQSKKSLAMGSRGAPPPPATAYQDYSVADSAEVSKGETTQTLAMASLGSPPPLSKQQEERERKETEKNLQLASRGAPPPRPRDKEESDKISEKQSKKSLAMASRGGPPPPATAYQDYSVADSTEVSELAMASLGSPPPLSKEHEEVVGFQQAAFSTPPDEGEGLSGSGDVENAARPPTEGQEFTVAGAELVQELPLAEARKTTWWMWWTKQRICLVSAILVVLVGIAIAIPVALTSGTDDSSSEPPELWTQLGRDIDGEAPLDQLGETQSVSLSRDGTTIAVGALLNGGNGEAAGSVRVFQLRQDHWNQTGQDIDGESQFDQSGFSIDLSADGKMLAVGAMKNLGNGYDSGHVRVFQLVDGFWNQVGKDLEGTDAYDLFGTSVSLSANGKMLAVGATQFYDDPYDGLGYARVFRLEGGTWSQMGEDLTGEDFGDRFGFAVSLSYDGLTLAVTGPSNGNDSGFACIYNFVQDQWNQTGQCIYGQAAKEEMGFSLSLSAEGSMIALGAPFSNNRTGLVRVYEFNSDVWVKIGNDIEGESNDRLGWSISLSSDGKVLAVGATQEGIDSPGYAVIYQLEEGAWVQPGRKIVGENATDQFGHSISLAGDGYTVAVGAPQNDGNGDTSGHVQVYRLKDAPPISTQTSSPATPIPTPSLVLPGTWSQVGQDLDGEAPEDQSGVHGALSLSEFGTVVAVGAFGNGDGGEDAGHVRVYQFVNDFWNQIGMDIDGDSPNEQFGRSVALSSDGTTLAIGAWANVVNGTNAGRVRSYVLVNGSWTQIGQELQGSAAGDQFGVSVSLSSDGSMLAVGASQNIDSPGYVRVFRREGIMWSSMGQDLLGESNGENFGQTLSLSADGSTLAVGAPGYDYFEDVDLGRVRAYQFSAEGSWEQSGQDIYGEAFFDMFGNSLALSADGSTLAIAGAENDSNGVDSGHVQVYILDGGEWTLLGQEIEGKSARDRFGASISLSSDGTVLAVGADQYDDSGSLPGYASIFRLDDEVWKQVGDDVVGKEGGDNFGSSISLSGDGRTVAVGAYNSSNANGESSGQVRIFYLKDDAE